MIATVRCADDSVSDHRGSVRADDPCAADPRVSDPCVSQAATVCNLIWLLAAGPTAMDEVVAKRKVSKAAAGCRARGVAARRRRMDPRFA